MQSIQLADLARVTGGTTEEPSAPTLNDLRSTNTGFDIGPPTSHIGKPPVIKPIAPPYRIPGG